MPATVFFLGHLCRKAHRALQKTPRRVRSDVVGQEVASHMLPFTMFPSSKAPWQDRKEEVRSFIFLKPHANTDAVKEFVKTHLLKAEFEIIEQDPIHEHPRELQAKLEKHYSTMHRHALTLAPEKILLQPAALEAFQACFQKSWKEVLSEGGVLNAAESLERLDLSPVELKKHWELLEMGRDKVKLRSGVYAGRIHGRVVVNGFYIEMWAKMTEQLASSKRSIAWFDIRWTNQKCWRDFRTAVVGDTLPASARHGSLRRRIYEAWKELGLPAQPSLGENALHASASPFEAMVDRHNWMGTEFEKDDFGEQLLREGIVESVLRRWSCDPIVNYGGRQTSIFDLFENLDHTACLERARQIKEIQPEPSML